MLSYDEWKSKCAAWMDKGKDGVRGGPEAFLEAVLKEYGRDDPLYNAVFAADYAAHLDNLRAPVTSGDAFDEQV